MELLSLSIFRLYRMLYTGLVLVNIFENLYNFLYKWKFFTFRLWQYCSHTHIWPIFHDFVRTDWNARQRHTVRIPGRLFWRNCTV